MDSKKLTDFDKTLSIRQNIFRECFRKSYRTWCCYTFAWHCTLMEIVA